MKNKLLWGMTILIWPLGIVCLYNLFYAIQRHTTTFEYVTYMIATFVVVLGIVSSLKCLIALYKDKED